MTIELINYDIMIFTAITNKLFGAPKKKDIKPVNDRLNCIYFDRFAKTLRDVSINKGH